MTTPDAIANAARIDRGDKADEIDEALNHGRPVIRDAMAKQGVMTGIAVGGCCDLSTSAHHLIDKIGTEQGYLMAESTGMDIDDGSNPRRHVDDVPAALPAFVGAPGRCKSPSFPFAAVLPRLALLLLPVL